MSMITLTTSTNSSTSLNNPGLGEASFSSYLMNNFEEKFVRTTSESNKKITKLEEHRDYLGTKKEEEDGEIGVFGAEKYFNGVIGEGTPRTLSMDSARKHHYFKAEEIGLDPMKPKFIPYGTPSVRSESSWNSQSALLWNIIRDPLRRKTNRVQGKSFLSSIRCKCYCSDKDSVDVDEQIGEISFKTSTGKQIKNLPRMKNSFDNGKPFSEPWIKDDPFTFPIANSGVGILPLKIPFQEEDRKSLEVFGSPVLGKRNKLLNIEKRIRMLSWDANPTMDEAEFSATCRLNCNDTESDASSDLFEIESLTGKLTNPFLARTVSDTATSGCISPPHCYAPSEASIEWSVVTASAVDYSAMSDSEERRSSVTTATSPVRTFPPALNGKTGNNREMQRRRSNSFLGCKSQKALRVAGDVYRLNEKANFDPRMDRGSDSYVAGKTRLRAETELSGFESRQRKQVLAGAGSLSRSHSPRAPQLFLIQ
ncbi:hypothetical protein SLE2022_334810 [Rubroshorea leprosula]